jgi:hypothetical protein
MISPAAQVIAKSPEFPSRPSTDAARHAAGQRQTSEAAA